MLREVYGHLHDNSNIIIVKDSTFLSEELSFQDGIDHVLEMVLSYESSPNNLVYFSLRVKDSLSYLNVDKNNIVISPIKKIFWLHSSSVDNFPRSKILSDVAYTLATTTEDLDYDILLGVRFLPTTWYEDVNGTCMIRLGISNLFGDIKGYTTKQWCNLVPNINYCEQGELCNSKCIGKCADPTLICYVNGYSFVCDNPSFEPTLDGSTIIPPQVTGTGATVIAIIFVLIIIALIVWAYSVRAN